MRKSVGFLLLLISLLVIGGVAAVSLRADYWLLAPKEKFLTSWQEDVKLLRKNKSLPAAWDHIREVEVKSDNSPAMDWIESLKKQIKIDTNGTYKLNVMVIHWIEKTKYGAIVQYSITDTKSGNTIWEISRTLHLGYLL
jgi:hypothetical protein